MGEQNNVMRDSLREVEGQLRFAGRLYSYTSSVLVLVIVLVPASTKVGSTE